MSRGTEREEYWHWFHGLTGITYKEKEELLALCPDVKAWYEAAGKKGAGDLMEAARCGNFGAYSAYAADAPNMLHGMAGAESAVYSRIDEEMLSHDRGNAECMDDSKKVRQDKIVEQLQSETQRETLRKSYDQLKKEGIKMTHRESENFPEQLRTLFLPPFVLYYYGSLPREEEPSLAVIGARNCSVYGEEIAESFSRELVRAGICIVSGMARGIDGAAQRAAINAGGAAYAVLGSGVDVCYPKENKRLYEQLKEQGGVISEELPGTPPVSWNFPKRNRIISGLSDAVFVVEARKNSGSLITVSYALEQGKEIYAIPGRIYEKLAEGTNLLIQEGAYLVAEPEDILQGFREKYGHFLSKKESKNKNFEKNHNLLLASREKIVYACLSLRPKHMEQIQEETEIPMPELSSLLFDMEMKHYIKQPLKNYFIIKS